MDDLYDGYEQGFGGGWGGWREEEEGRAGMSGSLMGMRCMYD